MDLNREEQYLPPYVLELAGLHNNNPIDMYKAASRARKSASKELAAGVGILLVGGVSKILSANKESTVYRTAGTVLLRLGGAVAVDAAYRLSLANVTEEAGRIVLETRANGVKVEQ